MVESRRYKANLAETTNSLRDALFGEVKETADSTDLHLIRSEFMARMLREEDGQQLLDLMESGEWTVCERLGLCNALTEDNKAYIDVPRWNTLVQHLKIVNNV